MARAVPVAGVAAVVALVCREIRRADFPVHLGASHAAPPAPGSTAQFFLAIHGAALPDQSVGGGGLVLEQRLEVRVGLAGSLAVVRGPHRLALSLAGPGSARSLAASSQIQLCGMKSYSCSAPQ